jgi:hypothetical protein
MKLLSRSVACAVLLAGFLCPNIHRGQRALAQSQSTPTVVNSGPLRFEERLILDNYGYAYGIAAGDLDGDGDVDLTSSDTVNDKLYWFENGGNGNLTRRLIYEKDPGWFERHAISDINQDGHPDIAIVKNDFGDLLWFENSGTPATGGLWTRHVITERTLPGVYDVAVGDLDADGDPDIAVSSYRRGNLFAWYENHGEPESGEPWAMHVIETNLGGTRTIAAVDINNDGKLDLVGSARVGNVVLWYENTGKSGSDRWRKRVIDGESPLPTHGHPVDMDGDSDSDIVMALGMHPDDERDSPAVDPKQTYQVAWYENVGAPGRGEKWQKHFIGELFCAFEAVAGDLDGDGDLDVVATAWCDAPSARVVWFENPGDPHGRWKSHLVKKNWAMVNQVIVMDLDQDGRLDIAAVAERGANEFRWWRNLGK